MIRKEACSLMPYRGSTLEAEFPHLLEVSGMVGNLKELISVFGKRYVDESTEYFPCLKENCPYGFYQSDSKTSLISNLSRKE